MPATITRAESSPLVSSRGGLASRPWWRFASVVLPALAIVLGVSWRTVRYGLAFPIWGDEAFLALNVREQSFTSIFAGMRYCQVVPVLFFWATKALYDTLGGSEWVLRFLPFVAGLASLGLMARVAGLVLPVRAAWLATALLAVSYYPVRHACELKPYAFDLCGALLLLWLALEWCRSPASRRWPLWLSAAVIMVSGFSNPSIFVAAGIAVLLGVVAWYRQQPRFWMMWAVYCMAFCVALTACLVANVAMQTSESLAYLERYWSAAFPPLDLLGLLLWLVRVHTGNMFAYPLGGPNGGSAATFLLCIVGAVWLWRSARKLELSLLVLPVAATLAAAFLHRYPYGTSARVAQHLAPAICLSAAAGIWAMVEAFTGTERQRQLWTAVWAGALAVFALVGLARDITQPFKTTTDHEGRRIAREITAGLDSDTPLLLVNPPAAWQPEMRWYLGEYHRRVRFWEAGERPAATASRRLVCITIGHNRAPDTSACERTLRLRGWLLRGVTLYSRPLDSHLGITEWFRVCRWAGADRLLERAEH